MTSIFDADLWDVGKFTLKEVLTRPKVADIINNIDFEELYYAPCTMRSGHYVCRSPRNQGHESTRVWHNDCDGAQQYLGVWASHLPTELLHKKTREEMSLEPYHLYLFNNSMFLHKMPRGAATHHKRWFVRYNIYTRRFKRTKVT